MLFSSCNSNVGLGESVDTEAPTISIEYPPSNSIVREHFTLAGSYSDDRGVAKVVVTIAGYSGSYTIPNADLTKSADSPAGTWQVTINQKNDGAYPLPDGKYTFNAVAYDDIGRTSGVAERAIEIDNAEPVFIIRSPGVTTIDNPTSYGTTFKVSGNIADDHNIKTFDLSIFKENGEPVTKDGAPLIWTEENVPTAGGTELTFAQYVARIAEDAKEDEKALNARYLDIYDKDVGGDQEFYCTVKISDEAGVYRTPRTGEKWNTDVDKGTTGNTTTKVFLYDDVYKDFMGKTSQYKLVANDFKSIFNGTYGNVLSDSQSEASAEASRASVTLTKDEFEELKNNLLSKLTDTSKDKLAFKLNKDANPRYEFGGYALGKDEKGAYTFTGNSASKGSKISFTAKMGLDETNINPKTITAYVFGPFDAEEIDNEIEKIYQDVKKYYEELLKDGEHAKRATVLFDGEKDYDGGTVESFQETFTLPDIADSKKYVFAAYGTDEDETPLVESVEYGFEGVASGQPPRLTVKYPNSSQNVIGVAGDMNVNGYVTSSICEIDEISYLITVENGITGATVGTIDGKATLVKKETKPNESLYYDWNFDIRKGNGYSSCVAKEGDNYKYFIQISAKNKLNLDTQLETTLIVDAKKPECNALTVSPRVAKGEQEFLNGTVTVSGNLTDETELADGTNEIAGCYWYVTDKDGNKVAGLVEEVESVEEAFSETNDNATDNEDNVAKAATDSEADNVVKNAADEEKYKITISSSEKQYKNLKIELDTTKISGDYAEDGSSGKGKCTLHIYVIDKAGNVNEVSYPLNIDQATDIPEISCNKADGDKLGIEGKEIQVTVKDDDELALVTYKLDDGEKQTLFKRADSAKKTEYSHAIELPKDISTGKHTLIVYAEDYVAGRADDKKKTKTHTLQFIYDNANPTISIENLSEFQPETVIIKGTASDLSGIKSVVGELSIDDEVVEGAQQVTATVTAVKSEEDGNVVESKTNFTWSAEVSIANPDEKVSYKWTFTATDNNGRKNEGSVIYKVDKTAPKFIDDDKYKVVDKDGKENEKDYRITFTAGQRTCYTADISNVWFKKGESSITISGKLEEANPDRVIMHINGKGSDGTTDRDEDVTYTTATSEYSINSPYYDGSNTVTLTAYDKAGNKSETRTFSIKVDTNEPRLEEGKTVVSATSGGEAISGTVNTKTLYASFSATDIAETSSSTDVSGLKQILIGSGYGFKDALYDSGEIAADDKTKFEVTNKPISLVNLKSGTNTLYIRLIDVAGNQTETEIANFTYDADPVSVTIVSPVADGTVNKTLKITGSVSDNQELPTTLNGRLETKDETGNWKLAKAEAHAKFSNTGSSWTCEFDTMAYNPNGTNMPVTFRVIIPDAAGNENTADEGREIIINQDSDRPKIVLTNIDITGTSIKQSRTVYGSLSDDDSDANSVVKGLWIIKKSAFDAGGVAYPTTTADNGWTKLDVQLGSGSFSHEGSEDGLLAFYFYCIDNAGAPFYWQATDTLSQMKIAGKSDKIAGSTDYRYKDETGGISYTADMAAPVVTLEVARGTSLDDSVALADDAYSAGGMVFSKTNPYSKLYLRLKIAESVGMKTVEGGDFAHPTIKLNSKELVLADNLYGTMTEHDYSDAEPYHYVCSVGPIDLAEVKAGGKYAPCVANDGQWLLNAEVLDASDQKGASNLNITMDSSAPEILITSPSASIGDAVLSAITVKGLAQDAASSIKSLSWAIPLSAKIDDYTVANSGLFTPIGNSTAWEIQFTSGSKDSPDSLLYFVNVDAYKVEAVEGAEGIFEVPIYFSVEDSVGNKAVRKTSADGAALMVYVDKYGGSPKAWINSPENNATTSGSLTIYGGASDNISVEKVQIQVDVNGDGKYDSIDYSFINDENLGADVKTALGGTQDDWYISATGTNSWKMTIDTAKITSENNVGKNDEGKPQPKIGIRCRAWDGDNNTRAWGGEVKVNIDSSAPVIRDVKLVQFGDGADPKTTETPVAELEYTSDVYISNVSVGENGKWYLTATITDNMDISAIETENITISTSTHIITLDHDLLTDTYSKDITPPTAADGAAKQIFVPIDTTQSGMVYSRLTVKDGNDNQAQKELRINIDSTPPSLFKTDGLQAQDADDELRLKPSNSQVALGKNVQVVNSNGLFTFGDYVQEAGSGLAFLAFYFEREKKAGGSEILDPMNPVKDNIRVSLASNKSDNAVYKNADGLPALYLNSATRNSEDSLTSSYIADYAGANKFIRKGAIVKIGGSYRLITNVSGDKVNFTPPCSVDFTEAEIVFAQIVDHQVTETVGSDGKVDSRYDDGDGMIESVNHIGSSYIWSASIDSSNIADGPIYIGVAAIDNAGNIAKGRVKTAVSNNRPRIAKVLLGTDLSGDGKYSYDASNNMNIVKNGAVISKVEREQLGIGSDGTAVLGEFNYYSGLNGEALQDDVTLASQKFKVRSSLVIIPEFVGGNGDLKYVLGGTGTGTGNTKPLKAKGTTLADDFINVRENVSLFDQISEKGYVILPDSDLGDNGDKEIKLTFWDSTEERTPGVDTQKTTLTIPCIVGTTDNTKPTAVVTPFYWKSNTDNSVYYTGSDGKGKIDGHIELPVSSPKPAVSGRIKVEGYVYDDWRLGSISMQFEDLSDITKSTNLADYDASTGKFTTVPSLPTGVVSFAAKQLTISQSGHWASYELVVDTEKLTGVAGENKTIAVTASDHTTTNTNASGANSIPYIEWMDGDTRRKLTEDGAKYAGNSTLAVDVVPYITGVWTSLSEFYRSAPSVYARTAQGHYPVYEGEEVTIYGYNLASSMTAKIDTVTLTIGGLSTEDRPAMTGTGYNVTIPSSAKSGSLELTVNGVAAINNTDENKAKGSYTGEDVSHWYNRQPNNVNNNTLDDDVFFDVWEFKNAAEPKNGPALQPHMKIGPTGQIGFSYANATLYFNMPGQSSESGSTYTYGQTPFGRNFGGFTQNAFTYDSAGRTFGVALCPDTSGAAGMSANLQFFSGKSALAGGEDGDDLNNNYYNQQYARRIENTSIKLDGSDIMQNINRILSPSMATYRGVGKDGKTYTYVYVAYYDELSKQVRFRVGSVEDSSRNSIGMGLVDLAGTDVTGRVSGSNDAPKLNKNTTRDSITGYMAGSTPLETTINSTDVTNDIYIKVTGVSGNVDVRLWVWGVNGGGDYFGNSHSTDSAHMIKVSDGSYVYKLPGANTCQFQIWTEGGFTSGDCKASSSGIYQITSSSSGTISKYTGSIKYAALASSMPTYAGYQYCHVVAANGVSNGTAEYSTATPTRAGQYVAVGSLKNGTAVIAWYDSQSGRLAFSYNDSPRTAQSSLVFNKSDNVWQKNAYYVSDESVRAGTYVSMAVDASDGIHLAYYSASGGDLWYSYIADPTTQKPAIKSVMVDSYGSVGTYTMIDVAKDAGGQAYIPYISFRCDSNSETAASVKIAYPFNLTANSAVSAGVDGDDRYTGAWEVSVVPTENTPITDYTNVGVNKDWTTGVRKVFETGAKVTKSWSATFAVGDSTTVYGNGTKNPVVSYAVSENGVIEMAQKK